MFNILLIVLSLSTPIASNIEEMYITNKAGGVIIVSSDKCEVENNGEFLRKAYSVDIAGTIFPGCWNYSNNMVNIKFKYHPTVISYDITQFKKTFNQTFKELY